MADFTTKTSVNCLLCGIGLRNEKLSLAQHLLSCAQEVIRQDTYLTNITMMQDNKVVPFYTNPQANDAISYLHEEGDQTTAEPIPAFKKRKRVTMTVEEYDTFLKTEKQGRFERVGDWKGMSGTTLHRCTDTECAREWKPSPSQCLPDDYYCPSCVLHHRNNVARFQNSRLAWTADVPNTFYVFSLQDPEGNSLVKFGRTQHGDATKRYSAQEIKKYNMSLLVALRGRLENMTNIENWWKEEAQKKGYFCKFSDQSFHGQTECLKLDPTTLQEFINKSKSMST